MNEREHRFQRRLVLILTIVPLAGFLAAVAAFWGAGFSPTDATIAFSFYMVSGLGITVGYHRLFTHQSFEAARPLKIGLAIAGSMAVQGAVIDWVATHRRHHAFSDRDGDPHSPHLNVGSVGGGIKGLWHAHVGWLASPERTEAERWAPDMLRDRDLVRVNAWFERLTVLSFVLPGLIGGLVTWSVWGGVTAFLWGSLARIFLLHHVTWSINSICHFFGKKPFESDDESTNNLWLSVLSFGESWHNNHHAFPTSAVHGIGRGQVDPSGAVIRLFEKLHLARKVKVPSPKQLTRKAMADFTARSSVYRSAGSIGA